MNTPANLKYTKTHEWVRVKGDVATFGITDYAQEELSEIVFVELPEPGEEVEVGQEIASVESVKAASDIYAPVSGELVEVNDELTTSPEAINASPYAHGWIARIRMTRPAELKNLLTPEAYEELVGGEPEEDS